MSDDDSDDGGGLRVDVCERTMFNSLDSGFLALYDWGSNPNLFTLIRKHARKGVTSL